MPLHLCYGWLWPFRIRPTIPPRLLLLLATFDYFRLLPITVGYILAIPAAKRRRTRPSHTPSVCATWQHACATIESGRAECGPPYPARATLGYFSLLSTTFLATFAFFLQVPAAKRSQPQQSRSPGTHARHQCSCSALSIGRTEYGPPYPRFLLLLATFLYFQLLLTTFAPFCQPQQPTPAHRTKAAPKPHP